MRTNTFFRSAFRSALLSLVLVTNIPVALAMAFTPGDIYSSNYFSNTISHYTTSGIYLDSQTLSPVYGNDIRGISFSSQGWLYAVTAHNPSGVGFGVVALDSTGTVRETYAGSGYYGNLSYGKIAFATNGQFFVAGANNLVAFTPGASTGSVVYTNNQVFDVEALPSGNLLVLSAYQLQEITTTGSIVRTITPNIRLVDARGVEYDPATDSIYVTMLGYSGQFFRLMLLDGASGAVEVNNSFWYGDDMFLTADNRLIVGSRTQAPGIFDMDLNQVGRLTGGEQMFVTQMSYSVPEPTSVSLVAIGAVLLVGARLRRMGF